MARSKNPFGLPQGGGADPLARSIDDLSKSMLALKFQVDPAKWAGAKADNSQKAINSAMSDRFRMAPGATPEAGAMKTNLVNVMDAISGPVGAFTTGLTTVTSGMTGFYDSLSGAGSQMGQFVSLFSPGLVLPFQQALRDLGALIGSALAPAFEVLTEVTKEVGASMAPVFGRLAEVIRPIVQLAGGVLLRIVKAVSDAMQTLAPIVETAVRFLVPVVDGLFSLGEAISVVITSLLGGFADGLDPKKNGFVAFAEGFKSILQKLASGLILVAAVIAKWFGAEGILKNLESGLAPRAKNARDITGLAAAQGAQFGGVADFGKRMALAASIATGAGGKDKEQKEDDWRRETIEQLKALREGNKTIAQVLWDWGTRFAPQLAAALAEAIRDGGKKAYDLGAPEGGKPSDFFKFVAKKFGLADGA
jgi:hypothetical protein